MDRKYAEEIERKTKQLETEYIATIEIEKTVGAYAKRMELELKELIDKIDKADLEITKILWEFTKEADKINEVSHQISEEIEKDYPGIRDRVRETIENYSEDKESFEELKKDVYTMFKPVLETQSPVFEEARHINKAIENFNILTSRIGKRFQKTKGHPLSIRRV